MKCIHCSTENTYKDRKSGSSPRCKKCHHPFAFEPKTDALTISDTLFEKAIKDVSADGTLAFSAKQLWYEVNRRLLARKTLSCGAPVLILALIGAGLIAGNRHAGIGLLGMFTLIAVAAVAPKRPKKPTGPRYPMMPFETFERTYLNKWIAVHGAIPKLLVPASRKVNVPWAGYAPDGSQLAGHGGTPDAAAYSFDRALITDHADIAEMLVANHFHFENNCAILSVDGYPGGTTDTIKTMLNRNPNLKVFALHNATIAGCVMARMMRQNNWFPNPSVRIIDLGLRPLHVIKGSLIAEQRSPVKFPVGQTSTSLSPEEIAWLELGNTAELHALRPNKLMRAIYQGFARAGQTDNAQVDDDGIILVDSGPSIWIYDSGMDVYASDSFG